MDILQRELVLESQAGRMETRPSSEKGLEGMERELERLKKVFLVLGVLLLMFSPYDVSSLCIFKKSITIELIILSPLFSLCSDQMSDATLISDMV